MSRVVFRRGFFCANKLKIVSKMFCQSKRFCIFAEQLTIKNQSIMSTIITITDSSMKSLINKNFQVAKHEVVKCVDEFHHVFTIVRNAKSYKIALMGGEKLTSGNHEGIVYSVHSKQRHDVNFTL